MKKNLESLTRNEPKKKGKKLLLSLLILVLLAAVVFAGWSYYNLRQTKLNLEKAQFTINSMTDPQKQQELLREETQKVLDRVKKHILVPTDEEPVLSIITDIDALVANQPFYKNAHNGDKILIFQKAGWGLVYDPSRDLIINVGPVSFGDDGSSANNAPAGNK